MTLQEFAKLKKGDKIENRAFGEGNVGEVVSVEPNGVRVVWGPRSEHETPFFFGVQGTAWMHWNTVETEENAKPIAG